MLSLVQLLLHYCIMCCVRILICYQMTGIFIQIKNCLNDRTSTSVGTGTCLKVLSHLIIHHVYIVLRALQKLCRMHYQTKLLVNIIRHALLDKNDMHLIIIIIFMWHHIISFEIQRNKILYIPKSSCSPSPRLSMFSSQTLNNDDINDV